ncbi:MAG: alanine:cation symporter family protein [Cyclobacteriaceae bacterium]|nr:alanine:cation symporter family protein [Cyclobacteriaceae bacterium]
MEFLHFLENIIVDFANWVWGLPLLILLLGGGLALTFYSRFVPFKYFRHAINILRGKYDQHDDPGQLNHYQALSTALAATVGMGNISGVAVAIAIGGPGAMFWMWISAFVGMATKYFSCTLAVLYRGKDSKGEIQGGPMYVIVEGLGQRWRPLAVFFCLTGMIGALPIFQANQLTQAISDIILVPLNIVEQNAGSTLVSDFLIGTIIAILVSIVIFGGIKRIGKVAGKMVPLMVLLYFIAVLMILILHYDVVPYYFKLIFVNAFTADNYLGEEMFGGTLGGLIVLGTRRAAFSNEAGIGTAPMAHGTAKTKEPVREGLVAMLGPAIDTLLVCTLTALAILVTNVWQTSDDNGVSLTANAFNQAFPGLGSYILMSCILIFSFTSLFSYAYYGSKCLGFIIGAERQHYYHYLYIAGIFLGATSSLASIISLIDSAYALMAIPTMISTILLAPRVRKESLAYFKKMGKI